jgi:hypothetical protein
MPTTKPPAPRHAVTKASLPDKIAYVLLTMGVFEGKGIFVRIQDALDFDRSDAGYHVLPAGTSSNSLTNNVKTNVVGLPGVQKKWIARERRYGNTYAYGVAKEKENDILSSLVQFLRISSNEEGLQRLPRNYSDITLADLPGPRQLRRERRRVSVSGATRRTTRSMRGGRGREIPQRRAGFGNIPNRRVAGRMAAQAREEYFSRRERQGYRSREPSEGGGDSREEEEETANTAQKGGSSPPVTDSSSESGGLSDEYSGDDDREEPTSQESAYSHKTVVGGKTPRKTVGGKRSYDEYYRGSSSTGGKMIGGKMIGGKTIGGNIHLPSHHSDVDSDVVTYNVSSWRQFESLAESLPSKPAVVSIRGNDDDSLFDLSGVFSDTVFPSCTMKIHRTKIRGKVYVDGKTVSGEHGTFEVSSIEKHDKVTCMDLPAYTQRLFHIEDSKKIPVGLSMRQKFAEFAEGCSRFDALFSLCQGRGTTTRSDAFWNMATYGDVWSGALSVSCPSSVLNHEGNEWDNDFMVPLNNGVLGREPTPAEPCMGVSADQVPELATACVVIRDVLHCTSMQMEPNCLGKFVHIPPTVPSLQYGLECPNECRIEWYIVCEEDVSRLLRLTRCAFGDADVFHGGNSNIFMSPKELDDLLQSVNDDDEPELPKIHHISQTKGSAVLIPPGSVYWSVCLSSGCAVERSFAPRGWSSAMGEISAEYHDAFPEDRFVGISEMLGTTWHEQKIRDLRAAYYGGKGKGGTGKTFFVPTTLGTETAYDDPDSPATPFTQSTDDDDPATTTQMTAMEEDDDRV